MASDTLLARITDYANRPDPYSSAPPSPVDALPSSRRPSPSAPPVSTASPYWPGGTGASP